MAVIKIKTIKQNLQAVINYAKNGDKTENGILVSGVNCIPDIVYEEMALVKKKFKKQDKILGYHIIQSFDGKELSPIRANELGVKLAKQMWGDKFQVVVCTHINKDNIHNHIVLNSVSFVDGKKYHNSKAEIALLKDISDKLCEQYEISVLDTPKANFSKTIRNKTLNYYNRNNETMQKIKNDIDEAIENSTKWAEFKNILSVKGYEIYDNKYYTVKSPYFNRNIRLEKAFGRGYDKIGIQNRIYSKSKSTIERKNNERYESKINNNPLIDPLKLKISSFYRLYVHYLYVFKIIPEKQNYEKSTPQEIKRQNERTIEELNFITRNDINSIEQVENYIESANFVVSLQKGERENLWRKYGRLEKNLKQASDTDKEIIQEELSKIKVEIGELTEEINKNQTTKKVAKRVITRLETWQKHYEIEQRIQEEQQKNQEKQKKHQRY